MKPRWQADERYPEPAFRESGNRRIYEETDAPFTCQFSCPADQSIRLVLDEGDEKTVTFTIDRQTGTMTADYTCADNDSQYGVRTCRFDPSVSDSVRLDCDGCVITLILGDGFFQYTTLLYPPSKRIRVEGLKSFIPK